MLHGILDALGGTTDVQYERTPDGKMVATHVKMGPGQQWKRIIAGGLTGAASAAQTKPGPGFVARAAGAGFNAGYDQAQGRDQQKYDRANQDFEASQQAMVRKAQIAKLNMDVSTAAFGLSRSKVNAQFEDASRENELTKSIANGGMGSTDLGVANTFDDVLKMHKEMPDLTKQQAQGNIIGIPHVNEQGQYDGMHYALVTPEWKNSKTSQDETFFRLEPPTKPGDKPKVTRETVKAGSMTNGDFWTARMAAEKPILSMYEEQYKQGEETKRTNIEQGGATARTKMTLESEDRRATEANQTKENVAAGKGTADTKALQKEASSAAEKIRPMANLLDSAEKYYGKGKFDSAGDLGLIIQSVRAMNPGSVRLPNTELEMEIRRGTYGERAQRFMQQHLVSGTLPNKFRDELMGVIRNETTTSATSAAQDWVRAYGGTDKLPQHLRRFAQGVDLTKGGGAAKSGEGGSWFSQHGGKALGDTQPPQQ